MAKRYRMTPARRASLRKAQLASARKRRKAGFIRGAKTVGSVAGTIAVGVAVHHVSNYGKNPRAAIKDYNDLKQFSRSKFGSGPKVDPNAPGVRLRSRKPLRYYGRGRATHIRGTHTGTRIRSKVR